MKKSKRIALYGLLMSSMLHLSSQAREASKNRKNNREQHVKQTKDLSSMKYRGVVYDVGLQFNPGSYSVEPFNPELVKHDMMVIAKELHANAVRIEGEEISRLVVATEAAHKAGLHVFFNPWKMHGSADETIAYMNKAAIEAEKLKRKGIDLVFVAGCEYTIFSKGAFLGETFNERISWMITNGGVAAHGQENLAMQEASKRLNVILAKICERVRSHFTGPLTYSSGTWEDVDWKLFDIVGIDYYRRGESAEAYVTKLENYKSKKPLVVMEVGSCAYEGAAEKGDGGFAILQGTNPDGTGIYAGGKVPVRSEKEQADYIETQVNLLNKAGVNAVFVYVFSFPIMPFAGDGNRDLDMTSYSLVKSFPKDDPRSKKIPTWEKKEAFDRLAKAYSEMNDLKK